MRDPNLKSDIACAIMAGGKNKRMGCHKAFLQYRGKKFIELVRENMEPWFDDIFIVTNDKTLFSDNYGPVYEDIVPDLGPIGALYTALSVADTEFVFCVACDMPHPNDSLISRLLHANQDGIFDCLVPQGELGPEPLFALYRTSLLSLLEQEISSNRLQISWIYNKCRTNFVDIRYAEREIVNINTPDDYLRLGGETKDQIQEIICLTLENELT